MIVHIQCNKLNATLNYVYTQPVFICTVGMDVVLGTMATMDSGRIPSEQRFEKLKHSRGSGVLSVEVLAVGPTRLLRITDENERVKTCSSTIDQSAYIHTCSQKRELSASPFMQCCVLYCIDQNHFEYACKCNTDLHVTP